MIPTRGPGKRRAPALLGIALLSVAALTPVGAGAAVVAPVPAKFLVGTAAVNINPKEWPVAAAAYGMHDAASVQAGRDFMARSIAISSMDGAMAHTVVLTVLDSQGYFIAYKEDPVGGLGFGTAAIRQKVMSDRGLDPEHVIVATTHTHNSPDSIGVWGGGQNIHNVHYLAVVRDGAIASIEGALANRKPATLSVGMVDAREYQDTLDQVRANPTTYPIDRLLRVLQAKDAAGKVVATMVNYGDHGTVLGPEPQISPDWPGEVAYQLDARLGRGTTVVVPGAVGRTWPNFPNPHTGSNWQAYLAAFGRLVVAKVDAALARTRPIVDGTVGGTGGAFIQAITDPAADALLVTEACPPGAGVCGTMRSVLPPYLYGVAAVGSDLTAFRVGDLFIGGAPAEAYPEVATELQSRVLGTAVCGDNRHVFALSLTNDQLGYTPTADEYSVAVLYGGDEGIFSVNPTIGNDVINRQLANARTLGLTTGPDYTQVTPLLAQAADGGAAPPFGDTAGPAPNCAAVNASTSSSGGPPIAAGSQLPPTSTALAILSPGFGFVLVALGVVLCCAFLFRTRRG